MPKVFDNGIITHLWDLRLAKNFRKLELRRNSFENLRIVWNLEPGLDLHEKSQRGKRHDDSASVPNFNRPFKTAYEL